jgi:hypothetical protein
MGEKVPQVAEVYGQIGELFRGKGEAKLRFFAVLGDIFTFLETETLIWDVYLDKGTFHFSEGLPMALRK